MSRKRLFVLSVGLAAMVTATGLAPVLATYPGAENGRIAFGVRAADGSSNIFSAMPDGTGFRQLTTGAGNHLCAAYSANGQQIAYCADDSGSLEIWTMKPNGTRRHQLTHMGGFATFPDFSPNGSKVAFTSLVGPTAATRSTSTPLERPWSHQGDQLPRIGTGCINGSRRGHRTAARSPTSTRSSSTPTKTRSALRCGSWTPTVVTSMRSRPTHRSRTRSRTGALTVQDRLRGPAPVGSGS